MSPRFSSVPTTVVLVFAVLALAFAGCGGSDDSTSEPTAKTGSTELTGASLDAVCEGKAQVRKGLDEVKAADLDEPTGAGDVAGGMDEVRQGITAITEELDQLTPEQRTAIQSANEEFTDSFTDIGFELADALPKSNAQELVDKGAEQLEAAFDEAYGEIKCP